MIKLKDNFPKTIVYLILIFCLFIFIHFRLEKKQVYKIKHLMEETPFKKWKNEFTALRDPKLGYIPKKSINKVYKELKSGNYKSSGAIKWESRGPYNVGGRTRAIMFDPNDNSNSKVWAGSVTGGLWYNNDITEEETEWEIVDDFWANLGVTSICYDPNNTQVFYVGTGEGWWESESTTNIGMGILKSEDGGNSWEIVSATQEFGFVNDMIVRNENGASVLYVAIDYFEGFGYKANHGIYRSADGGITFTQVLPEIDGDVYSPADIEVGADNRLYVGTKANYKGKGGGTVLFSDDGLNWTVNTLKNDGYRVEIATAPSNENYVYALISLGATISGSCYAVRSTDKGESWEDAEVKPNENFTGYQAEYDLTLCVHPHDHLKVYAGAVYLIKSDDGMKSWKDMNKGIHADHHIILYRPETKNDEMVFGNDGGVYYVYEGWQNYPDIIEMNNGYVTTQFYSCAIHPEKGRNYFLAGSQDNGTEKFNSTGIENTEGAVGGDGCYCFISESNPKYQIASHIGNSFYRSSNNGKNWSAMNYTASGRFVNPADYDDNMDILFSSANYKQIHRFKNIRKISYSSDVLSVNLSDEYSKHTSAIKVSTFTDETSTIFIGTSHGKLYKIENANTDTGIQTDLTGTEFPTDGYIRCINLGGSEDEIFVVFSNYGVNSIWYTDDGGTSWLQKDGNLPDMPIRWIISNPYNRDKVMVATQFGIWATDNFIDENPEWNSENNGLANVRVDMLRIRKSDNIVIAATHGRGLYSTDSWEQFVGVDEDPISDNSEITVYPNPFTNEIRINNKTGNEILVQIFDLSGKQLFNKVCRNQLVKVPTKKLSAGCYVLKLIYNNEFITHKVIKK